MIAYYIHHHGRGHLQRATAIAQALGTPVTALSSFDAPADPTPFLDWVQLPRDDVDPGAVDHTAGGAWHWAPLAAPGYRERMAAVVQWIIASHPDLVVVDVSVEITTLCRLLGVPVVVMAGAGKRDDRPHESAYQVASRIIAPWHSEFHVPRHLRAHLDKTDFVGAISRFDDRTPASAPGTGQVVVLFGAGGAGVSIADVREAQAATPRWTWRALGVDGAGWCDDVWAALQSADVVVTHAGQNALAEIAAARRAAVVLPQDRPFGEQAATGRALDEHAIAVVRPAWPTASDWPAVLGEAALLGGQGWKRWSSGDGAARAAAAITKLLPRA